MLVYVLGIVFVLLYMGQYNMLYFDFVIQMLIFVVFVFGFNIVVGLVGLFDFGYIVFFVVGVYLWGIFGLLQFGEIIGNVVFVVGVNLVLFWLFILLVVVVVVFVGVLIGLLVFKFKGDYFVIVMLGFGEVICIFVNNFGVINGLQGIDVIQSVLVLWFDNIVKLLGFLEDQYWLFFLYLLVLVVIGIVVVVNQCFDCFKIGCLWIVICEDEVVVQVMGVLLLRIKLFVFVIGVSFVGVMGVIFVVKQVFIDFKSFDYFQSIGVLSMVILGGMGNIVGVMVGVVVVMLFNLMVLFIIFEVMQVQFFNINQNFDFFKYQCLIFGLVLVFMMFYCFEGLVLSECCKVEMYGGDGLVFDSLIVDNFNEGGNIGGYLSDGSVEMFLLG